MSIEDKRNLLNRYVSLVSATTNKRTHVSDSIRSLRKEKYPKDNLKETITTLKESRKTLDIMRSKAINYQKFINTDTSTALLLLIELENEYKELKF